MVCGAKKAQPDYATYGYRNVIPAGQLYTGAYHRSLRRAADALTDQSLIWIMSARHGLVPLKRPLFPYDTRLGDEDAVTAEKLAAHTAALGLDDADVIFLGGQQYATLLKQSVPHALTPLRGGLGDHRAQCHAVSRSTALADSWWKSASHLADHDAEALPEVGLTHSRVPLPPSIHPSPPATARGTGVWR